jgi:hypothetical protein
VNIALSDLVNRLTAASRIDADDVLALRAQVYGAGDIAVDEIEALIALDGAAHERAPEWADFFAEAMTDFAVHQANPPDYVDDARAAWLIRAFSGPLNADSVVEALARILAAASETPASLAAFALTRTKASVCDKGQVTAADVALLRRIVFAGGGGAGIGVSREEADALFDINDACRDGDNDPAWADFFAKAIGDHLTAVSPFQAPRRADAARDEAWLESSDSMGGFVGAMAKVPDVGGFVRDIPDILDPMRAEAREWEAPLAQMESAEAAAAPITDEEARWLIGRLGKDALSPAERALIEFLRAEAPQSSGLLKPLLGGGRTSDEPSRPENSPVFGHRRAALG